MHLAAKARKIFLDSIRITVKGGSGGPGLPKYGGIGGKGGDVFIQGSNLTGTLNCVKKQRKESFFQAQDGDESRRTCLVGSSGKDLFIKVPLGVAVQDSDGQHLGDINKTTDKICVALGGRGGDKFNDNQGFVGQKRQIKLDLKMISDAVLVGFPNAGKSSLLRAISKAVPRVASFPFTTLRPYLGVVNFGDYRQITVADLPGLVEGAHKNLGLGHEFLKHMVRARVLIFVIDVNPVDLGPEYKLRSPLDALFILNKEIELYDDTILNKPAILAISKMDTLSDSMDHFIKVKIELQKYTKNPELISENMRPNKLVRFEHILPISSESRLNIETLKNLTRELIDKEAEMIRSEKENISSYKDILPKEFNRIVH